MAGKKGRDTDGGRQLSIFEKKGETAPKPNRVIDLLISDMHGIVDRIIAESGEDFRISQIYTGARENLNPSRQKLSDRDLALIFADDHSLWKDSPHPEIRSFCECNRDQIPDYVSTHRVDTYLMARDPVTDSVFGDRKEEDADVLSYAQVDFSGLEDHLSRKLTLFDKAVFNSVVSLLNVNNRYITASQIANVLNGDKTTRYRTESSDSGSIISRIVQSIDKMTLTRLTFQNEAGETKYVQKDYLLPAEFVSKLIQGQYVENVIFLYKVPRIYQLARDHGRTSEIPLSIRKIGSRVDSDSIEIMEFLIRHVLDFPGESCLDLERIYSLFDLSGYANARKKKLSIRNKTKIILDSFQEKGFIISYEWIKEYRVFRKIRLLVPENESRGIEEKTQG